MIMEREMGAGGGNEYEDGNDEEGGHGKGRTSRGTCNTTHHLYSLINSDFLEAFPYSSA